MNPDAAAMPLETPISVPENCGAMSMWLTKNPHKLTPDIVVESVISVTASAVWVQLRKLTPIKNNAPPNAPKSSVWNIRTRTVNHKQVVLLSQRGHAMFRVCQ